MATSSPEYLRLDRHIRTSATVSELAHWEHVRQKAVLTRAEHKLLEEQVIDRVKTLMARTFGKKRV